MNGKLYWKNRLPFLFVNIFCMLLLSVFLLIVGNSKDSVILILLIWLFILTGGMVGTYRSRKRQMDKLLIMTEQLEERYFIAELMKMPPQADDQVFYQILKLSCKSMLEKVSQAQREHLEYREYIEQWLHEVKTPITAMKLLCENNRSSLTREILVELEKTNYFTEQVLYYARSEHTEKDYIIQEVALFEVVHQAIADNKYLLLQNNVSVQVEETDTMVYSDGKWIRFLLNQFIVNAVKYRTNQPTLQFYTKQNVDQVILIVKDNGIGISSDDLPRIFEKGFTGQNGRNQQNSTGIGLYLCKRLCDKLGIGIKVCSKDRGTKVMLHFQINHFIYQVQN